MSNKPPRTSRPALRNVAPDAVASYLGDRTPSTSQAPGTSANENLTPAELEKVIAMRQRVSRQKARDRDKARKQAPNRSLFLLPDDLRRVLALIAEQESVSQSQVATFLLYEALHQYQEGKLSFEGHKRASNSPRWQFELVHPNDIKRAAQRGSQSGKN